MLTFCTYICTVVYSCIVTLFSVSHLKVLLTHKVLWAKRLSSFFNTTYFKLGKKVSAGPWEERVRNTMQKIGYRLNPVEACNFIWDVRPRQELNLTFENFPKLWIRIKINIYKYIIIYILLRIFYFIHKYN